MFAYTYKLFSDQVIRFFGLPITQKRQFYRANSQNFASYLSTGESNTFNTLYAVIIKIYLPLKQEKW